MKQNMTDKNISNIFNCLTAIFISGILIFGFLLLKEELTKREKKGTPFIICCEGKGYELIVDRLILLF